MRRGYLGGDEVREKGDHVTFHYDAEERRAQRVSSGGEPPRKGWLRGNKSLVITLIDVVIVIGVFLLYAFFLRPMADREKVGPFTIEGQAFQYGEEVFVALTVTSREDPDEPWDISPRQIAVISPNGEFLDLLPPAGDSEILRFREPWRGEESIPVSFRVDELEGELVLTISLEPEKELIDGE